MAREAMRSRWEIVIADPADAAARLRAAGEEAFDEIENVEAQLSAYRPSSDLSRVNRSAADEPVRVSPPVLSFLTRAAALSAATDGAFDLTVGPLLRCWGFAGGEGDLPEDEAVRQARTLVGMRENVRLDNDATTVGFARAGVWLDPGAIGKGYALERALDLLREAGVRNALLHAGTSTVGALGTPAPGAPGWTVAVQHPTRQDARLTQVCLRDRALSVSAQHGKSFWARGRRFGHVLDPRTGQPVQDTVLAAVVAPSPTDTDALSTALLVLGAAGLPMLAARFPDAHLLVAREGPEGGGPLQVDTVGDAWQDVTPDG
uniref:FAD:protein FMN transferase n=1 Tax=uncultured Armatimonadetes bacterium TaxID=157466 RepID=A0A6J4K1U2_9BACT|nr:FAD:protein FMN transferase [uncultured Armatimonadetes bacterium]